MSSGQNKSYYVQRAITRKILNEGTGLRVDRMKTFDLWRKANASALLLHGWAQTNPSIDHGLARAIVDLLPVLVELEMRGEQLELPFPATER